MLMPAARLSMRKILEILRLAGDEHRSIREIADSVGLPHSTVGSYLSRFRATGLPWPLPADIDEATLEVRLFASTSSKAATRPLPDWSVIHRELKRKGVTLQLLWQEYKQQYPDGYQYTRFCLLYRAWAKQLDPVLRQEHRAGEKVFVDYAGPTIDVVDPATGEARVAQLFVAVLGASNFLYAEATWTQSLPDWIASHVRMLEYFGGVPELIVPDNLKSGVRAACYYEPDVNPTYHDLAVHYGTTVLPARAYHPRDKAKVESGVQVAERWILAPLRHHTFTSLVELNRAIAPLREALNDRPFQKMPGSRRSLFHSVDRPALRPLPPERYELAEWRVAKVNIDYHISVEGHLYSVPYTLVRREVSVRLTASMIEVLHQGKRVALHPRRSGEKRKGGYTTDPTHRPKAHQAHLEWTPSRLVRWGESVGAATGGVVQHILESKPHPEMGYRACLGLLSLGRRYTNARLEAACRRALDKGVVSYKSVKSILATGLDRSPAEEGGQAVLHLPQTHAHVRGADYYRRALGQALDQAVDARDAVRQVPLETVIELPLTKDLTLGDITC
jgi:transposase